MSLTSGDEFSSRMEVDMTSPVISSSLNVLNGSPSPVSHCPDFDSTLQRDENLFEDSTDRCKHLSIVRDFKNTSNFLNRSPMSLSIEETWTAKNPVSPTKEPENDTIETEGSSAEETKHCVIKHENTKIHNENSISVNPFTMNLTNEGGARITAIDQFHTERMEYLPHGPRQPLPPVFNPIHFALMAQKAWSAQRKYSLECSQNLLYIYMYICVFKTLYANQL